MRYVKNKELIIIIIVYVLITINFSINHVVLYTNLINPIFWLCILIYSIRDMKNYYIRFSNNKKYFIYTIIIVCIHVVAFFYIGFILGFVKSPYNHKIGTILKNMIIQLLPIISIEVIRSIIANINKDNKLVLIFITILLILVEIQYNTILKLCTNREEFFKYILSNVVPLISCSILYTYLVLKGSYSLTLICRLPSKLMILFLPILPDINWFITGAIGVLSPTIFYVIFKYAIMKQKNDIRKKKDNSKISYVITLSFAIFLVCFMLGVFKYEPITILSNSMIPVFKRGDVLIYKKIDEEELKEIPKNSIIVYKKENKNIAHRVVDVIKEKDIVLYQTKGDNNNVPDFELVETNQIKGVYVLNIKYIGLPSVWLFEYFNN